MASTEITRDSCDQIIQDLSYVQDEAEALEYVIETVPYDQESAEGHSIFDLLYCIDYLQVAYYKPLLNKVADPRRELVAEPLPDTLISDLPEKSGSKDIIALLKDITRHRTSLIVMLKQFSIFDWEREVTIGNSVSTVYEYIKDILLQDRGILKEIASLILAFQKDQMMTRQISERPGSQP